MGWPGPSSPHYRPPSGIPAQGAGQGPASGNGNGNGRQDFGPGHTLSTLHGGWSASPERLVATRVDELVPVIFAEAPHLTRADTLAVRSVALAEAMVERLADYIATNGEFDAEGKLRPVVAEFRSWTGRAEKARIRIGLDPMSRAALGLEQLRGNALAEALLAKARRVREERLRAIDAEAEEQA